MNNYRNNNRKNRFRSNGDRSFKKRSINIHKSNNEFNPNSEFKHRNPGRNNQNAAKLIDKYNNLAREALTSGDKILSENYLQHADHFSRVLKVQEITKNQIESNNVIEQNFKKDDEPPISEENKKDIANSTSKVD
tara:strand:+ start:983 stop:1387 length:405 start_codon:yes stop_codon:yes gene_type:complete